MTYLGVATMAGSEALGQRVIACAALQGQKDPKLWVANRQWQFAAQPGWETAWDNAKRLAPTATTEQLGANADVITDAMILSAVQALRS